VRHPEWRQSGLGVEIASGEGFFDLGGELGGESVEALSEVANELKEIIVGDEGRDGGKEPRGSGDEGFGDARCDRAQAGGARSAESGEGVNDAPDGAEQADEGSDTCGGGKPGHALFDAADFFGGSKLHADDDGLNAFNFCGGSGGAGGSELALEFAITGSVDVGERRAGGDESLGVGYSLGGAENFEKLVGLATDAAEEAELLEDHGPGDQGKEKKKEKDGAGDPAGLRENVKDVADKNGGEKKNWENPSEKRILGDLRNVAHGWNVVKRNEMRCLVEGVACRANFEAV
jgi:hypothetical protein